MAYENIIKEGNFHQTVTGDYGFKVLSGTDTTSLECRAIQALEETVLTTTTSVGDALSSVTLPSGTVIFGKFDSITLTSGKVLAYLAS